MIAYRRFPQFGRLRTFVGCEDLRMIPKDTRLDRRDDSAKPLENQPLEWADEDREMEDRKPDLGEIEEDTSEL